MDWKSSLEALRDDLPDLPDNDTPDTPTADTPARETARLDIILDKKGRKGKAATIIAGFTLDDDYVDDIARRLRQKLGTGGSSRGGEILIQGDKRKEVAEALASFGLKARII